MNLGPIHRRDELEHLADKINLIRGTRVGFTTKQKYQDYLTEMAAQGHLTTEEYGARMEWIEAAQTEDELRVVLIDLPRMPLTEAPAPKQRRSYTWYNIPVHSPWYAGTIAAVEWAVFIVGAVTGQLFPLLVGLICGLAWTYLTVKRIQDGKEST
jgi:hypothetical protein